MDMKQTSHSPPQVRGEPRPEPLLGRLNRRGFRLLMAADAVVLLAALVIPMLVREAFDPRAATYPLRYYVIGYGLAGAVHFASFYFSGLYEREQRLGSRPVLPRIASMAIGAMLLVAMIELFTGVYVVPRLNLLVVPVLVALGLATNRRISRWLRRRREGPARVLLVGAPDDVNLARSHLADGRGQAVVVGSSPRTHGLLANVEASGATEVLLLSSRLLDDVYPEPLITLERRGVGVLQRITAQDTLLGLDGVREIAGLPFVVLGSSTLPRSRARFKRFMELLALLAVAPLAVTLTAAVAAYVRIVAGSPVLYWQDRVGRDGRVFRMVKFRTMYGDAERNGPTLASADDPRIVPACRWLRATRMDELPQLWNVLRGEMSVVGPRPERPEITARLEQVIPGYARRHEVPPGITGLAQIHGRYHTDPEYKLGHDLQYLVNWSPVLDLQILLRTIWVVLARRL